jgi:hypothetical protein
MKKALKHNSKFITFKYKNQNQMHRKHYCHIAAPQKGIETCLRRRSNITVAKKGIETCFSTRENHIAAKTHINMF